MDNTFAARSARLSRDFPARSPPIHPRVPTTRPQQAETDSSATIETSQPIAQLPDHETASQLVQRLRIAPDLVQVYCSTHPSERPLFISQALLVQKSPLLLVTAIQPPHHHRDHHHRSIGPASLFPTLDLSAHSPNPTVLSIFIYWLFHSRVPDAAAAAVDVNVVSPNQTPHQHQQHQISLTHAWNFAKDWNLPLLQNEILKAFFRTLEEEEEPLDAKTFETCLEISSAKSALRFALLAVLLWWDDLHEELLGGSRRRGGRGMLSDTIDIRGVEGFEEDFERALGVWEDEGRRRGRRYNAMDDVYVESRPWGRERPRAELFFV